ncbi:MAG: ATP-binding protein, partial [Gammaproteobacteria bacterium]
HHYKIEIKNERIGVKSLNFRGLLKRFKRGSNAAEVPGSGLGLSIANEAIMALKGDLKIFQSRGNTICATVSLPFS